MSRSLILAFMIALILHVLLAGVELDLFKRPLRARNVPKALTVDVIEPIEARKPSKAEKPPTSVTKPERPVIKTSITRKPKEKSNGKPTIKRESTGIKKQRPLSKKEPPKKAEAPPYLPSPNIPREKEVKDVSDQEYAFVPDIVNIPKAPPKREDLPHAGEEAQSPVRPSDEPLTFATPNYKKNSPPPYPLLARRRNYEGTVLLDVLVRKDGTVGSLRLSQSSGHETLDQSAIKAVSKWTFHPGKRGDESLEMWVTIPIRFQLK
ncbi:MAG: hypothetical protein DRG87_08490 [Deltaproteobacteria bacterium]|nr:MAG: hypothetical protein DRG87_08490 [Deltaproteobacteria bacterium]